MTDLQAQVETTRSWTGLWAVALGDVVIAVAAILGVYWVKGGGSGSTSVVSIITSGFTAIGTLTTAYFGIKAVANTANTTTLNPGNAGVAPHGTTGVPPDGPPSALGYSGAPTSDADKLSAGGLDTRSTFQEP